MKKIILSIIGLSTLITIPLSINFTNSTILRNNEIIDSNNKSIAKNLDNSKSKYNPSYPSFKVNLYITANAHTGVITSGGQVNPVEVYSSWEKIVNVFDYAPDKSTFTKNYSTFKVEYDVSNYHDEYGKINHGWYREKFYQTINTNFSSQSFQTKEYGYHNYHDTSSLSWYEFRWNGNYIEGRVHAKAWGYVHKSTRGGIEVKDEPIIFSATFNSSYNINSLKNKIKTALNQPFTITSDSSPNISSIEQNGKPGNLTKSNKQLIDDEIQKRLKTSFGVDYAAWFSGNIPVLKINTSYDDKNSIASITLKDESRISGQNQFVTNVKMPINVNLTDYYFQRESQKRLEIVPGKIVNPNSLENQLMIDNPEYDPKSNTFTYHNSVDVTFTGLNSKEIMYVNGDEVPVYKNVYRARLDDNRDSETDNNTYSIIVNGIENPETGKKTELKLNVKIDSLSNNLNYRWLGWNPEIYSDQKKLITKTNDDGSVNTNYDPTINPETGMRNQYIFVNDPNNKYPFYIDPLDKWGNIIKEDDPDKKEKSFNGYIAEAYVANSGITLLNELDIKNIAKIERVKLNLINFTQNGNIESIIPNMSEQWSQQGLWHYIIYMKDYVDRNIDPSNPGVQEIKAKSGSTIHKLIYISKDAKDYTNFLNLNEIMQNQNVLEFWSSIPGKHLKNYLVAYTQINTSSKIEELSYEQLILYWKQYVSDQFQQIIEVPSEPVNYKDLTKLEISSLKMNEINPIIIQEKIINHVSKIMINFSKDSKYGIDYEIYDSNNVILKDMDFKNFIDIENESKSMELIIKASSNSTLLTNEQNFKIYNNKDYDEDKALDLSIISLKPVVYNFTDAPEEVKNGFIDNYILNYVNQILEAYRPIEVEWQYLYGEDYYISINGLEGEDIKNQNDFEKIINKFLNSKEKINLEITIVSIDDSIKLTNYTKYLIVNNPESDDIAPKFPPDTIGPDTIGPDTENPNIDTKNSTLKIWIIVIILVVITFGLLLGVIIWKRKKVKKIK